MQKVSGVLLSAVAFITIKVISEPNAKDGLTKRWIMLLGSLLLCKECLYQHFTIMHLRLQKLFVHNINAYRSKEGPTENESLSVKYIIYDNNQNRPT